MAIICAACYLSDFLIVLSPYRLIAPITRHGGRGGGLLVPAACLFGSFAIAVSICPVACLRGFCVLLRLGLSCLLGYRIMYLSMGDVVARRFVSGL